MASNLSFRSYLWQWVRAAVAPTYDFIGWVAMGLGAVLWAWHKYRPENFQWTAERLGISPEVAMSDPVWIVPLTLGALVLVYRLARAPYEIHRASLATAELAEQKLQGQLARLEGLIAINKPRLSCHIDFVHIGSSFIDPDVTIINLVISVRNEGLPSVAESWRFWVTLPDGPKLQISPQHQDQPLQIQLLDSDIKEMVLDGTIYDKTATPIANGGMVRGYAMFLAPEIARAAIVPGTRFDVECEDISGRRSSAEYVLPESPDSAPYHYPGFDLKMKRR
jgi:hypothetical protein